MSGRGDEGAAAVAGPGATKAAAETMPAAQGGAAATAAENLPGQAFRVPAWLRQFGSASLPSWRRPS